MMQANYWLSAEQSGLIAREILAKVQTTRFIPVPVQVKNRAFLPEKPTPLQIRQRRAILLDKIATSSSAVSYKDILDWGLHKCIETVKRDVQIIRGRLYQRMIDAGPASNGHQRIRIAVFTLAGNQ